MCINSTGDQDLPKTICDTSTLSLTLDNQGVATIQITILKKTSAPITARGTSFNFNGNTFKGFIDSDTPRRLEGTDYFEHVLIAIGMIC